MFIVERFGVLDESHEPWWPDDTNDLLRTGNKPLP